MEYNKFFGQKQGIRNLKSTTWEHTMVSFSDRPKIPGVRFTKRSWAHLQAHEDVIPYLKEAVERAEIPKKAGTHILSIDMERVVGTSICVQTSMIGINDSAIFSIRNGRVHPTRVVLWGKPEPTSRICMVVDNCQHLDDYEDPAYANTTIITAYFGVPSEREPHYNKRAREIQFWSSHALIYDKNTMSKPFVSTWRKVLKL